ncbi:hypothetical protein ACH5RR_026651 [Cinchona calisaya]|uniref:Polyprotein n=1 Tax=Cinchona calisaya TaxID=153742 RepID=A0ABD2Z4B3_9GENT
MHFLLTTLNVVYVLNTPKPMKNDEETLANTHARQKWENDDYICRGQILNGMSKGLFDTYQNVPSSRALWNKLEARYMKEDATSKKFLVSHFFNFKMIDGKSIMEHLSKIDRILNNFKQHNLNMDESIIVSSVIDKLPPSWSNVKRNLEDKKEELSLEDLANHLRLEEMKNQDEKQNAPEKEQSSHESKIHAMKKGPKNKSSNERSQPANFNKFKEKKGLHANIVESPVISKNIVVF